MMWDRTTETKVHEGTQGSDTCDIVLDMMEIQLWQRGNTLALDIHQKGGNTGNTES